jgi:hypothetical protein
LNASTPVQNIRAGIEAFRRDLERALKGQPPEAYGWCKADELTLLVPMFAENETARCADFYLLKLSFDHYSEHPPSAQFINPITLEYNFPDDVAWVPLSQGHPSIHFHTNYSGTQKQLICSSTTLEFYKVNHQVDAANVWNPDEMNFKHTLAAIRAGLSPSFYKGRSTQ